jgi:hypothetical protein
MSNSSYSDNLRKSIEDAVGRVQQGAYGGAVRAPAPRSRVVSGRLISVIIAVIVLIVAACAGVAFIVQDRDLFAVYSGGLLRRLIEAAPPGLIVILVALAIIAVGLVWYVRSQRRLQHNAAAPAALPTTAIAGQITRLEQLREWMGEDKAFAQLVDSMIGRQVQAAEGRQRNRSIVIAVVTSVLSLVAGWLLTAISPGAVAALVAH